MEPTERQHRRLDLAILGGFALALLTFVMLTWAKWPTLTADGARELYVPFQIRHGALIYRDFYYLYGPVAPCFQAGLLWLFGERLDVLYVASALQLATIMGLLYAASRHVLGPWPSAAVLFLFFTHFALGRDLYGYMWPYAFAATYAVLFGLTLLVALLRHNATGHPGWLALGGLALGLSLLTKLEFGAAALTTAIAYMAGRLALRRWLAAERPWWHEALALLAPAALVASAIAASLLAHVDWPTIRESVWPTRLMAMWNSRGVWHGTPATWKENLRWLGVTLGLLALAAGHRRLVLAIARSWAARVGLVLWLVTLAAFALGKPDRLPYIWEHLHRFWVGPSFALLFVVLGHACWRIAAAARAGERIAPEAVAWGLIAGYGLSVCARTLFHGMNEYTGFQAPVALVAWVALATCWLPARFEPDPARRRPGLALAAALMLLAGGRHLADTAGAYAAPHLPVTGPAGTVMADRPIGEPFAAAVTWLRERLRPSETVVAAPMEPSLYLFLGRDNPVKEDQLFYGYLPTPADQADFAARMRAANVRYFVLSSYGYPGKQFGIDYMQDLARWLDRECRQVATFGQGWYTLRIYETPFGMAVRMPEKPSPAGAAAPF